MCPKQVLSMCIFLLNNISKNIFLVGEDPNGFKMVHDAQIAPSFEHGKNIRK